MSSNLIARWEERFEHDRITAHTDAQVLEPESVHPGWTNLTSQRSVRQIVIAPKSRRMWMSTWGGVLSWRQREESTYYRYASEQGLAGNAVSCICVDEGERPWAGHDEGGLSYFDGHRWRVYEHLQGEPVRAVCNAGPAGGIWAASANAVYHIAGPEGAPLPVSVNEEGAMNALALLADGDDLLLGNCSGLFRLRRGEEPARLSAETVYACVALARDGRGRIWLGTPEAVYLLEEGGSVGPPLYDGSAGRVMCIAAGPAKAWVLTDSGLCRVAENGWWPIPVDVNQPSLLTIAASLSENYLWVGTDRILSGLYYEEGAEAVRWDNDLLPLHAEDKLSNLGRCIAASRDSGRVWVGTAEGLVVCETHENWTADAAAGDVRALCAACFGSHGEEQETLWRLAWPRGINPLHASEQPAGIPIALAEGQDGCAYALTSRGLYRLGSAATLAADDVPASAHCLAQTPDGVWWVGTTGGTYRYGAGGWRLANERPGPMLEEVHIIAVINAALWVVTEVGLWARRGARWESHSLQGAGNPIHVRALARACDAGKLWVAHDDGVLRYDPETGVVDREYTPARDGLASRRVTALVESNGLLWVATQVGISILKLADEMGDIHE